MMVFERMQWAMVCVICGVLSGSSWAAEVTNVRAALEGNRVVITYDLSAAGPVSIAVAGSEDGGDSWSLRMEHLSGHVGEDIEAGTLRRIVWDVLRDYPRGYGAANVVFKVHARGESSGTFALPLDASKRKTRKGGTYKIGFSGALTGPTSDVGIPYARGLEDYLRYVNDEQLLGNNRIEAEVRDDSYKNDVTKRNFEHTAKSNLWYPSE